MREESVDLMKIFELLKRNALLIVTTVGMSLLIALALAVKLPKEFKSTSTLSIHASYFESPIAQEVVGRESDPREVQSQKLALLRLALSNDFIDSLADHYQVYKSPEGSVKRHRERELLLERISFYANSPSTFEITVGASTPENARAMNREILEQMMQTLFAERYKTLASVRNAIDEYLDQMGTALKDNPSAAPVLMQGTASLEAELARLEGNLRVVLTKFTERHPAVIDLRKKVQGLRKMLESTPKAVETQTRPTSNHYDGASKETLQTLFSDLLKKVSYLNVALAMERDKSGVPYMGIVEQPNYPTSPVFPKMKVFLLVGALVGCLIVSLLITFAELKRAGTLEPEGVAELLGVPYFGKIPALDSEAVVRLIGDPSDRAVARRLPAPTEVG